jgi:small GTP-binding protein
MSVFPFKIMVGGDGGVGKTTLLRKYVTGTFSTDTHMTIGIEFHVKQMVHEGQPYSLQLWDLGGQDRFRFMLSSYCLGATGALLLFDLTRMSSLDDLGEWVSEVLRKQNPALPILCCGTKADVVEDRSVPYDMGVSTAKALNCFGYAEVSAKTGQNVERVFELLVDKIIKTKKVNAPPA